MRWNPTEKFTDTCLSVRYILPMNKAWITPLNVLIMMYRNKTEHYVSSQKWITALSDAYDTKVGTTLYAYGNQMIIDYRYQYIRTDWIEDTTYEEKVIHLLDEFLFHPCFDIDSLDKAKYMLKNRLKRQMDDPDSLAVRTALTQIPAHHSLCVDLYGEYDQVDAVSLGQINRLYREIKKAPCVVYSVGKISPRMTCLYSEASILPRSAHAASQICFSNPIFAVIFSAIDPSVTFSAVQSRYKHLRLPLIF